MNKKPVPQQQRVVAPPPLSVTAVEGVETGQELACRYWRDLVKLHAAIALAPNSPASWHTRMCAAREIRELAAGIPHTLSDPADNGASPDLPETVDGNSDGRAP